MTARCGGLACEGRFRSTWIRSLMRRYGASLRGARGGVLWCGAAAAAGSYGLYRWLDRATPDEGQPWPLRDAFESGRGAGARRCFGDRGLAPTYKLSEARDLRVNGNYGLKEEIAPENYRVQVVGVADAKSAFGVCGRCDRVGLQIRDEGGGQGARRARYEGGAEAGVQDAAGV